MHRGDGSGGGLQMFELVVEKDMGFQDVEHPLFLNPTKKEGFIHLDVPGVQRRHKTLVGRSTASRDDG